MAAAAMTDVTVDGDLDSTHLLEIDARNEEANFEGQRPSSFKSFSRLNAKFAVLITVGAALAWAGFALSSPRQKASAGSKPEDAVELARVGPFGERAGPDFTFRDWRLGAHPKYGGDPQALEGSPPKKPEHPSHKCPAGCQGTCCNGGNLCCGSDATCCGTSCCSKGSICCDKDIGLCCAPGSMCCFGKFCCAESFMCGHTRSLDSPNRYKVLETCGGGGQFRRLLEQQLHKRDLRRMDSAPDGSAFQKMLDESPQEPSPSNSVP
mmetsp:Transcript_82804/g.182024  ORF Transcript_82804/g.182024 Transcript_82804/m.182024 type:complete len:265 (+) Transcript_82804:76-870(+)